jgi:hypothetical protein
MADDFRTCGAALMLLTGLLYLLFEDQILGSSHHSAAVSRTGSRVIMGMQVRHLPLQYMSHCCDCLEFGCVLTCSSWAWSFSR